MFDPRVMSRRSAKKLSSTLSTSGTALPLSANTAGKDATKSVKCSSVCADFSPRLLRIQSVRKPTCLYIGLILESILDQLAGID